MKTTVNLPEASRSKGTVWAAGKISRVVPGSSVPAGITACLVDELAAFPQAGREGLKKKLATRGSVESSLLFRWNDRLFLVAETAAGLMYGLLEIAEHREERTFFTSERIIAPSFTHRILQQWFPFGLGMGYGQEGYEAGDTRTDWWWYDRPFMEGYLRRLAEARFNTISFWNVHGFPALLKLPRYPEAACLSPGMLKKSMAQFKWLIITAREYGIAVVLNNYLITYPIGFARKHGLNIYDGEKRPLGVTDAFAQFDTPLLRSYYRAAVSELFTTYPGLGGLCFTAEANRHCFAFIKAAVFPAMERNNRVPDFYFRLWGQTDVDGVRGLVAAYPGRVVLIHKNSEELIYHSETCSRILRWKEAVRTDIVPETGPSYSSGCNLNNNLWSDHDGIHAMLRNHARNKIPGLALTRGMDNWFMGKLKKSPAFLPGEKSYLEASWLTERMAGRYLWNIQEKKGRTYWTSLVSQHYGVDRRDAGKLVAGLFAAGAVVPHFTRFYFPIYGASVMPENAPVRLRSKIGYGFGGLLGSYTMTSVSDPDDAVPLFGGFAFPFNKWRFRILAVSDEIRDRESGDITPADITHTVGRMVRNAERASAALKAGRLSRKAMVLFHFLRLNILLGNYCMVRTNTCRILYGMPFRATRSAALKQLERGIVLLERTDLAGAAVERAARKIRPVNHDSFNSDFWINPQSVHRSLVQTREELLQFKLLRKELLSTSIPWKALRNYHRSLDEHSRLYRIMKPSYAYGTESINRVKKSLERSFRLAEAAGRYAEGVFAHRVEKWKEFLSYERERLNNPVCTAVRKGQENQAAWHELRTNEPIRVVAPFVRQLLSPFTGRYFHFPRPKVWGHFTVSYDATAVEVAIKPGTWEAGGEVVTVTWNERTDERVLRYVYVGRDGALRGSGQLRESANGLVMEKDSHTRGIYSAIGNKSTIKLVIAAEDQRTRPRPGRTWLFNVHCGTDLPPHSSHSWSVTHGIFAYSCKNGTLIFE